MEVSKISELSPDDIAALACQAYQSKPPEPGPAPAGGGYASSLSGRGEAASSRSPGPGLSRQELLEGIAKEARAQKALEPMDPAEYRQRQENGLRPELAMHPSSVERQTPLSYDELLKQYPAQQALQISEGAAAEEEVAPTPEELQRLEVLKAMERSQMPAVADGAGNLARTIEHYTFSDAEDSASFSVNLDKDLWDGASSFLQDHSQVVVDSRATCLEISVQGIPVSEKQPEALARWKLTLSPLFGRIEPSMTTHKVRGNKVTVKLCKSKVAPWKKGVKYS
eukprot:TRINITY_DN21767_c0_g1_i1.p1 TRINITY_DN21767_c0_g1~~TRINITY_DN21767_c0_g1_i1.p1  ORF type:complete len:293 (-),score=62.76 TRINITY_DN21767_c0_g1_i1:28-873(-)